MRHSRRATGNFLLCVGLCALVSADAYGGFQAQGFQAQGFQAQGFQAQGFQAQGFQAQGFQAQGFQAQGLEAAGYEELGIDRLRTFLPPLLLGSITPSTALFPPGELQGLESGAPITFQAVSIPPAGTVTLQRGPSDASAGNYIFVPDLAGTTADIAGTFWNLAITDDSGTGAIPLFVAAVETDSQKNLSKYPDNDDVFLYTVYYRQPDTGVWASLCPVDPSGRARAMAIPLKYTDWSAPSRSTFTFACTASGVAAKCARNWGYKPWRSDLPDVASGSTSIPMQTLMAAYYNACIIAARADYCQDDHSYTKNGTLVDLFDSVDGVTSINPTAGFPYAPFSTGVMVHEEYQVSALDLSSLGAVPEPRLVSEEFTSDQLMSMPDQGALVSSLRQSGMESSRYADLDPGRTCAAAPYITRCDPKEPYECYRDELKTQNLGAFIAVNSPRHCSHDEATPGEPLDPLCNECVNRICQVDPTCCADPGASFYPGSLVWDDRCIALRPTVCRSDTDPSSLPWPLGTTAPAAGSKPTVFLSGAIGSFEGIATEAGHRYAEGWACDPDHPGASVNVQISVGGPLGGTNTQLYTSSANQTLQPGWREAVAAECGDVGSGPHGFRFQLDDIATGPVYVYGIDLDVPGAPFSLLRGGAKTTPPIPQAAIWTGWVSPQASGNYSFTATAGDGDNYRVWINGLYVAGNNWTDPPNTPGGFLTAPTPAASIDMLAGVRYGVRVEYQRAAKSTDVGPHFALLWSPAAVDGQVPPVPTPVPGTQLYPIAQGSGNGLVGTYYVGRSLDAPAVPDPHQTTGAVDYLWMDSNAPAPGSGIGVNQDFAARFKGQIMPPISGDYTFSADTDGDVTITVNGLPAASPRTLAPPAADSTCTHDICNAGAAISKTCDQGFFCASLICLTDPGCCAYTWDAHCVQEVASVCGLGCDTASVPATLQAGAKYDIEVDYVHHGPKDSNTTIHGARLQLKWALPGTLAEAIPLERQFAGAGAPGSPPSAPQLCDPASMRSCGVGLNAAYFTPDDKGNPFATEILDHVEGPTSFSFDGTSTPGVGLSPGIVCGNTGEPACDPAAAVPGAPAITSPQTGSTVSRVSGQITVQGAGAMPGSTVTIYECALEPLTGECQRDSNGFEDWSQPVGQTTDPASTACGLAGPGETCGSFSAQVTLKNNGTHWLAAAVSPSVSSGEGRIRLVVGDAPNASAPAAPTVAEPPTGFASGNGSVPVGGSALTGDTVTVTATSVGPNSTTKTFSFSADAWAAGGTISLPPGDWTLTVTQTDGDNSLNVSASAPPIEVKVALPPLTLSQPDHDNASITGPTALQGAGALATIDGNSLDVIIGDGDGHYFAERKGTPGSHIPVLAGGTFSTTLIPPGVSAVGAFALDYGKHQLKVFQRSYGLDGAGVIRTVLVPPPQPSVTSPAASTTVGSQVTVSGTGLLRNGDPTQSSLPVVANVYQGNTLLGQATLDPKTGAFNVVVTIAGAGTQTLAVKQAASSLSGAGSAESDAVSITLLVRPPAPTIDTPAGGAQLTDGHFTVTGHNALPGALVTIVADPDKANPPQTSTTAGADGRFTADAGPLSLARGVHTLTAFQTTTDGAVGLTGANVLITVGDVTPPTVTAQAVSVTCDATGVDLTTTTSGLDPEPSCTAGGAKVGFAPLVKATDDVTALPAKFVDCLADGGACACSMQNGSEFPFGSSSVTCSAQDEANNVGSTTFNVTVSSTTPPTIDGSGLVAEAQGPAGAVVNYQISATGFVANCAALGSPDVVPCATWRPAYAGLGFVPVAVRMDPSTGTLYAGFYGDEQNGLFDAPTNAPFQEHLLASSDGGTNWRELTPSGAQFIWDIAAVKGTLYVASGSFQGVRISHDGGLTWTSTLDSHSIRHIWTDASQPNHLIVSEDGQPGVLFETRDGGVTWTSAGDGLPAGNPSGPNASGYGLILALAIDPISPDSRVYASIRSDTHDPFQTKIYRRIGVGPWQRMSIPAYPDAVQGGPDNGASSVVIAPVRRNGQSNPTVFAGTVYSTDGGDSWLDLPSFVDVENMVFSPADPSGNVAYATTWGNIWKSLDGGNSWSRVAQAGAPSVGYLIADASDAQTVYASSGYDPIVGVGLYKSTNSGGTWAPVEAPNISLPGARIKDLAVDPADPNVAYLLSDRGGVFKTVNAATTDQKKGPLWLASNGSGTMGIGDPFSLQSATKILIDPRARNNIYVGRIGLWLSSTSGDTWTSPSATQVSQITDFALDPITRGTVFLAGSVQDGIVNSDGMSTATTHHFELVNGTIRSINLLATFNSDFLETYYAQVVGDAGRTVITSWSDQTVGQAISRFSLGAAERASPNSVTPQNNTYGATFPNIVYDRSDGTDRLFAGGTTVAGTLPNVLYRATPTNLTWEALPPGGPTGFSDFSRLVIDPASGGQTMFTIGSGNTLWQSNDGGHNWSQDASVPANLYVTNIWLSPVDGALFATLAPAKSDVSALYHTIGAAAWSQGLLWRRTPGGLPPGARVFTGSLRVSCGWPDSVPLDDPRRQRAVGPGSTFPIDDDTSVACTATDAFGNQPSPPPQFTIQVRDRTPPVLTYPPGINLTNSGTSNTITVAFTGANAVTALDLVDGAVTPTCKATNGTTTKNVVFAGTAFQAGAWTVTCTAIDVHGNSASVSFPLVVSKGTPLTPPTLNMPPNQTAVATSKNGALVSLAVTATGATIGPSCTAPINGTVVTLGQSGSTYSTTFPIGTTEVTCSASTGGLGPLTTAESLSVTVNDGPPRFTALPTSFKVVANSVSGSVVHFDATTSDAPNGVYPTATDDVDGAITPSCAPASGSVFPLGTTAVICRASDSAGNRVTADPFYVTVTGVPPILQIPSAVGPLQAVDPFGAPVSYTYSASDSQGALGITCTPPPGLFPLGETTVSCSASNDQGTTQGTFVVTVVDTLPPTVVVPPTLTLEAVGPDGSPVTFTPSTPPASPTIAVTATDPGGHPLSYVVSTFDLVSGSPTPICRRVTNTGDPVTIGPGQTQLPLGDDVVSCSATDGAGNTGSGSFTVVVRDTTPPRLSLTAPPAVVADANGGATVTFDDSIVYATDAVSGDPQHGGRVQISCTPRSGSRFLVGATTVACVARDAANNEASGTFQVTVIDGTRGKPCATGADCGNGQCVDGVCCDTACGGGDPNDCQACSIAAGGTADGTCTPLPATHVCRPKAGVCDVPESCDGTHVACPTDLFVAQGQVCGQKTGACDVPAACTGSSAACPPNPFVPAGTTCGQKTGACDIPATCTGSSAACPPNPFVPAGTTCRPKAGVCDVPESCTGSSAACPPDAFLPGGTVCATGDSCHSPAVCSGTTANCPAPAPIPCCDKTPPVFSNVPGPIVAAYATCAAGAVVTYTKPTATDAIDGIRPVSCSPASGSMFAPGKTVVTCTASDTCKNTATVTFTVWVTFQAPTDGTFFLQPINPDGSSIFKLGSTVPTKFALQGASAGITNLVAKLSVAKVSSGVTGTFVEAVSTAAADSGSTFRYDSVGKQYVFNLSTKGLTAGTWSLKADLGDAVTRTVNVSLK